MKNIDMILRTMGNQYLESSENPKKARANGLLLQQGLMVVQAAELTSYAQRHNKNTINEIFDRSTLKSVKVNISEEKKLHEAGKTLAKAAIRKQRAIK